MKKINSVGVDVGGTWLRAEAVDDKKKPAGSVRVAAPLAHDLVAALKAIWKKWGVAKVPFLALASKGVWALPDRRELEGRLKPLAKKVCVMSDIELAFESAFTPKHAPPAANPGILILAGTGSIAFGRDSSGQVARAGGLGPSLGDEGSGFWIGKEYLRLVAVSRTRNEWVRDIVRSQDSVARIAALSADVLKKAKSDKACANIIHMAQTHLSELVLDVAQKLTFPGPIPVSWWGGLFSNDWFRKGFWDVLVAVNRKIKFVQMKPQQDSARAAAEWADSLATTSMKTFGYDLPAGRS